MKRRIKCDRDWCKPTVAVDLDGTLTADPWRDVSHIGRPARNSRRVLRRFIEAGWQVIIYTCRPQCDVVRAWADKHYRGLISAVNWNPDEANRSHVILPKPFASIYIDDKGWPLRGGPVNWFAVEKDMEERGVFAHKGK